MRNILGWIWFIVVQVITLILAAIGVVLLFPLSIYEARREDRLLRWSNFYKYSTRAWRSTVIDFIYGNKEDGIDGTREYRRDGGGVWLQTKWINHTMNWQLWRRIYIWTAWRNSTANLKFVFQWIGGPYKEWQFGNGLYFHLGWESRGWPVLRFARYTP